MNFLRIRYADQLVLRARKEIEIRDYACAWRLLEDAHVLSQPYAGEHLFVHWEMFSLAVKEHKWFEVAYQSLQLLLAAPISILSQYPEGNTGRSNVGTFENLPLPKKIEKKIQELDRLEEKRIENGGILPKYQRQHPIMRR